MKPLVVFLSGMAALCLPALSGMDIVPPAQIGLSGKKLAVITRYLEGEVDKKHIAGAVGLIARHGRIGYFQAVGMSDREAGKAMETGALFRIASMTKAITSAGVMMLVDEGEIQLDDPVSKYLPEFAELRVLTEDGGIVAAGRPPTIRELLTHTSGIGYGWFGPEAQDAAYREAGVTDILTPVNETLEERVSRIAALPLAFQPGEQWAYGFSIDVLGRVLEVVTGLTLDQFFRERIFRPLGIKDTHFYVPDERRPRLAALYTPDESKKNLQRVSAEAVEAGPVTFSADYCYQGRGTIFAGGSGLVASTLDYARFLQMLLDGGRPLLTTTAVDRMTRNQIGDLTVPFPGHGDGFGFGFGVLTERGKADDVARAGTFSWGGVFNSYYWVDPQEEMIGILMTQIFPYDHLDVRSEFKRLAYEAIDDSGFSRHYWFEKGLEHGNPFFNPRQLRVNAPEAGVHPKFAQRSEPRSSGMARIRIDEDLRKIRRADLYCEVWGGHPGTVNKRVTINGRSGHFLPEIGTAAMHCTHEYPAFNLQPAGLVNGYNSLQFACDQGAASWGHYIVDNACLRIGVSDADAGFDGFSALVIAKPDPGAESIRLRLETADPSPISSVHYIGRYFGYDENGDGRATDWHGMTRGREFYANLGSSDQPPFAVDWDTSMVPAQEDVAVKAVIRFVDHPEIVYETPVAGAPAIPARSDRLVSIHHAARLPAPFLSRAGKKVACTIDLDIDPRAIETAELHVATWTGGAGEVENYFTLNGRHFPVAEGDGHEVNYVKMPVKPAWLKRGANEIALHSDTEHHGIEVLLPGPALVIRASKE